MEGGVLLLLLVLCIALLASREQVYRYRCMVWRGGGARAMGITKKKNTKNTHTSTQWRKYKYIEKGWGGGRGGNKQTRVGRLGASNLSLFQKDKNCLIWYSIIFLLLYFFNINGKRNSLNKAFSIYIACIKINITIQILKSDNKLTKCWNTSTRSKL